MKYFWLTLVFLAVTSGVAATQEPVITPDTSVDSTTLHRWLKSNNPRLIAWAADFARRRHDAATIAEVPAWLEHQPMPPHFDYADWRDPQRRAQIVPILAVLDTLIQENAHVPLSTINAVALAFPDQAAILISRYPLLESRDTLDEWKMSGNRFLVRIATMMFAKDPGMSRTSSHFDLSFVGGVVADSESELWISVGDPPQAYPFREGGDIACGDGGGHPITAGWPQVYAYESVENDSNANGPVIVEVGDDRIASWRREENRGWGTCSGVRGLNPYTRQRLLAYWLGVPLQEMAWRPFEAITIPWTDKTAYDRRLAEIVESQRQKLRATADALRQRGVLTGPEAVPKLVVNIQCNMKPCPLP